MRLVAGVDVGNATTEVVVSDLDDPVAPPVAWDRRPTRGRKGTQEASVQAAQLLARLERRLGAEVGDVVVAPQEPVTSRTIGLERPPPPTGRLRVLVRGARTPAGTGSGVGAPVEVGEGPTPGSGPDSGPVVLVAREVLDFRGTSAAVRRWVEAGRDVRAVLLAGDEARLVSARVPGLQVPVVDG